MGRPKVWMVWDWRILGIKALRGSVEQAKALAGDATGENNLANAGVGWQVPN